MKNNFIGLALLLLSGNTVLAETMTITAEFTPSVANPKNDTFINTTPIYGYCDSFPGSCEDNGWFSLSLNINSNPIEEILSNDTVSFKMPSATRDVVVTNRDTGVQRTVRFAINGFGARKNGYGGDATAVAEQWNGKWINAPSGCNSTGWSAGNHIVYTWFWRWPNRNDSTVCSKTTSVNRGQSPRFEMTNFMYLLTTPNPLEMDDGVYEGQITYTVAGSGADINYGGPKYQTTDDRLVINFELTVTHEMSVKPVESGTLNLHACQPGKICSEAESKVNWEKATVTNIAPTLTAENNFTLTSSGAFTVYLQCEINQGEQCGIKGDKSGHIVPVQTHLTLPGNIQNQSGSVRNLPMKNVKDTNYALFKTTQFTPNGKGKFHFEVDKQDVAQMRNHAPDEYTGVVTVVFDPQVW